MERFGHPDVIWCGTDCFTEGHLVWTTNGYKDIKDVKCFDYVLTHTGEYKRVNAKFEKMDYQFYKIKISGCEEMLVTQNHPFLARKKKRINTHLNGEPLTYAKMLEPEWVSAKELTSEYRVGIRINNESKIPEWQGTTKAQANYKITPKEEIVCNYSKYMDNEDFWWFVGRYFGDGTLENKCGVGICCNKNEQHENEEIRNVLDKLDVKYYFYEKTTANHFYVFDKELYDFLMQFGKGALNKTITPTILDLPINLLKKFIDGYHSADGDIHYNGAGNEEWGFTTISKGLAYGIQQCMLKAYGVYGNITTRDNTDVIQGRKVNAHKAYTVRFLINRNENRKFYEIENGIAWVNVRKVEKQLFTNENKRVVYNMSVEDDESYTVNNIIVHNCTSYSVAAISKHRRKNPETGNLDSISGYAKFCDNMNIHVKELIKELNPELYFWENPRAGLRKMTFMQDIPRYTITYCQYMQNEPWEKRRMKPTDLWTNHPNPKFKPPCKNGSPCHPPAPRGSNKYGTQALEKYKFYTPIIPISMGKDSMVTCHLVRQLYPETKAIFNNTSLDCADTYKMVKRFSNCEIMNPDKGFYQYVESDYMIPTRFSRFCCRIFKVGVMVFRLDNRHPYLIFMGMRNEESNTRSNYQDEWTNTSEWGNTCWQGILPIRKWTELDVWLYTIWKNIEVNPKYKKGYSRVGCNIACPFYSKSTWILDKYWYPKAYQRWRNILEKDFTKNKKWIVMNCTLNEYLTQAWNGGTFRNEPTQEVIEEFAKYNNLDIDIAARYFNKECCNCNKRIKHKEVLSMNLKVNGRQANKFYCKKCLMKEFDWSKEDWDKQVALFKLQGCALF